MVRARQTARKTTPRRPPRPKPDERWIPQQNVSEDESKRSSHIPDVQRFVVTFDDHNFHHILITIRRISIEPMLNIVLKKYDARIDQWTTSKECMCSKRMSSIAKIKSAVLKADTLELYVLFSDMLVVCNFSNNETMRYPLETNEESVLLNLDDIIAVTECKSESGDMLLQIPHDTGLPSQSNKRINTIGIPSKHMILQFREDPSYIRKYCFFTKKWSEIQGLPQRKDHQFRFKSATLTSDENQVVIFAVEYRANKASRQRIVVLDMNHSNGVFLVSDIPCHGLAPKCIMRTGGGLRDEILVIGWVRMVFESSKFKSLLVPPLYLMQSITKWYSTEMIHALDQYDRDHYALRLDVIRSTLTPLEEELLPSSRDQAKDEFD